MTQAFEVVFRHSIDLSQYRAAGLDAAGLWKALGRFVRAPHRFVGSMTGSSVEPCGRQDGAQVWRRNLHFAGLSIRDEVCLRYPRVETTVPGQGGIAQSHFVIELVEAGGGLRLDFSYAQDRQPGVDDNAAVCGLRNQAWQAKDRDVVRRLLQIALA